MGQQHVKQSGRGTGLYNYNESSGCTLKFTQDSNLGGRHMITETNGVWVRENGKDISGFDNTCGEVNGNYVIAFRDENTFNVNKGVVVPTKRDGTVTKDLNNGSVTNDNLRTWIVGKLGKQENPGDIKVPLYSVDRYEQYPRTLTYGAELPYSMDPGDTSWAIGNADNPFLSSVATDAVCPLPSKFLDKSRSGLIPGIGSTATYHTCSYPISEDVVAAINTFRKNLGNDAMKDGRAVALQPIVDTFCNDVVNKQKDVCSIESTGKQYNSFQDQLEYCTGEDTYIKKEPCPPSYPLISNVEVQWEFINTNGHLSSNKIDRLEEAKVNHIDYINNNYEGTWELTDATEDSTTNVIPFARKTTYKFTMKRTDKDKFDENSYDFTLCKNNTKDRKLYIPASNVRAWNGDELAEKKCTLKTAANPDGLTRSYYEKMWKDLCYHNIPTKDNENCKCWVNMKQEVKDRENSTAAEIPLDYDPCGDDNPLCSATDAAIKVLNAQDKKFEETSGMNINTTVGGWEKMRSCYAGSGCTTAGEKNPKVYLLEQHRDTCVDGIQFCSTIVQNQGVQLDTSVNTTTTCNFEISNDDNDTPPGSNIDVTPTEDQGGTTLEPGTETLSPTSDSDGEKNFIQKYWGVILSSVLWLMFIFLGAAVAFI